MMNIIDIYEGILKGMDDTLANGDNDINAAMNVDTIPTVKDFKPHPRISDMYCAFWLCPDVLAKYKRLYPNLCPKQANAICICLEKFKNNVYFDLWLSDSESITSKRYPMHGIHDSLVGASLATYKKMAINVIDRLAKNPEKLDELMKHCSECNKKADDENYSFHQRSILNI